MTVRDERWCLSAWWTGWRGQKFPSHRAFTAAASLTKDGKNLLPIKKQWINYIGYRENYEKNLRIVIDDGDSSKENKKKAKALLNTLNEQYKLDAIEDLPLPTTTTNLTINKPRFVTNEAYKKEYIKRGKILLKKIRESTKLDDEDNKISK